ncbi:MAG: hypothetical protein MK110_01610 [Fuerstiella sp.]|nr:hypothetical protein [Fuerstiella sp.]
MPSRLSEAKTSETRFLQSLLPSSVASIVLHGLAIASTLLIARGCQQGVPADAGGEEYHTVGLVQLLPEEPTVHKDSDLPASIEFTTPQDGEIDPAVPETPPSVDELLSDHRSVDPTGSVEIPNLIGIGTLMSGADAPVRLVSPSGGRSTGGSADSGPDRTAFMNITDSGRRFVYLIDTSGSMNNGGRMELAQSQLLASLRMLEAHQEFQVIFYGDAPIQMRLRGRTKGIYQATAANLNLAKDAIETVDSGGGTMHLPALLAALRLNPDVVYFLTDGQDASLTKADLRKLLRKNSSGARIHVVEFAAGNPELRDPTWLQLLASETRGEYRRIQR